MKTFLRSVLAVLLVAAMTKVGYGQACAKLAAISQDFESGFGSWQHTSLNCIPYSNSAGYGVCSYTWSSGGNAWAAYGWSTCDWCIVGRNSGLTGGTYSAVSDFSCGGRGHQENILTSPAVNFAAICDPSLPPPTLSFDYAYIPCSLQDNYGVVQLSIEVTPDISVATPTWFVATQYSDLTPLATGPGFSDLGSSYVNTYYCGSGLVSNSSWSPSASQWKRLTVNLPQSVSTASKAAVRFRIYNDGGPSGSTWFPFYLDNISVDGSYNKDVAISSIGTFPNNAIDSVVVAPTTTFPTTASVKQVGNVALPVGTGGSVRYQIYPLGRVTFPVYDKTIALSASNLPSGQCVQGPIITFPTMSPVVTQNPGEYTVRAIVSANSAWDCNAGNDTLYRNLVVGYDYDVKPIRVILPTNSRQEDIVSLSQTPTVLVRNIGLNDVSGFRVSMEIYDPTNNVVWNDEQVVVNNLVSGTSASVVFKQFTPAINGIFRFRVISKLGSDLNRSNDTLIETRQFYWKYDVRADSVVVGSNAVTGLPEVPQGGVYRPVGRFDNNGASFIADIPITFEAWKLPITPGVGPEFTAKDTMPELNIADGQRRIAFNSNPVYNKLWIPQQTGDYMLIMYSDYNADGDRTNDTIKLVVSSIPRLLGVYQVGFGQQVPTFQAALDSLKYRGVRGDVTFQLMDNTFNFTTDVQFQAVRYAGPSARVTFAPGPGLSPVINLGNGARIAWDFGTSFVGFDGNNSTTSTPNRSLTIVQGTAAGTPAIFLARGASNNRVLNCNIRTGQVLGQTAAKLAQNSVGIWLKNGYPVFPNDTLACNSNIISNNDIEGFRTAIWLHGLSPIFVAGTGKYAYRWDSNNVVSNNLLQNLGRAGILATNQWGPKIYGNEVANIVNTLTNACGAKMDEDANVIGIGLGGVHTKCDNPFDNLGTQATFLDSAKGYVVEAQVYNNKVHDIAGAAAMPAGRVTRAVGIEVIQDTVWGNIKGAPSTFQTPGLQPTVTHNVLWNNMIWGLNAGAVNGEAVGVMFDARGLNDPAIPTVNGYFTTKDSIVNNTIWISGSNLSRSVALDLGRIQKGFVYNNLLVNEVVGGTRSLLTYTIQSPDVNLVADRNLYFFGAAGAAGNTLSRLTILDANGNFREQKTYSSLDQWQAGTMNDMHSVYGDPQFKSTTAPNIDLHIKSYADGVWSPARQQGALLLNSSVKNDFDGELRGVGGTGFDIGADEFAGKQFANDLYTLRIINPISTGGLMMINNPVNVQAVVQNVGTSPQLQKRVMLAITPTLGGVPFYDTIKTDFKLNEAKVLTFQRPFIATSGSTYNIQVNVEPDNNPVNDAASTQVKFVVQQNAIVVSYNSATVNGQADRDSVIYALRRWGFRYDLFDRNTVARMEDVSYAAWPTVIYCVENGSATKPASAGGGTYTYALSYDERRQLQAFLASGAPGARRSLIMAGMDVASYHDQLSSDVSVRDTLFTRKYLHAGYVNTPVAAAYSGQLTGVRIEPSFKEFLNATGADRVDALSPLKIQGGTTEYAYYYNLRSNLVSGQDSAAGVTFWGQPGTINFNTVVYGFDWRHLSRLATDSTSGIARVMLNTLDFIQKNGGCIVPCFVPVELASFDAKLVKHDVAITWETASEQNVTRFNVERRSGNSAWTVIDNGSVTARGTSGVGARYSKVDPSIAAGTYEYRLAYVHNDGHVEYSTTRQVVVPGAYALYQNYPNPFNPSTQIDYVLMEQGHVKLSLYDVVGNLVRVLVDESQDAGMHGYTFDASSLSSGVYYYRVEVNGFVQTRRLMLMK